MKSQRGGFVIGMIVGLLVGLAIALGVALYVTKVPVPFINKVPQHSAEEDAAEAQKNKNWDPNSPLYGKSPARPGAGASAAGGTATPPIDTAPVQAADTPAASSTPSVAAARESAASSSRNPADILNGGAGAAPAKADIDPFMYFVQAGAYSRPEDAEAQRAKLAMLGMGAKVMERELTGRTMYRVRLGPFDKKEDAESAKEKLEATGVEASLIRVQR